MTIHHTNETQSKGVTKTKSKQNKSVFHRSTTFQVMVKKSQAVSSVKKTREKHAHVSVGSFDCDECLVLCDKPARVFSEPMSIEIVVS